MRRSNHHVQDGIENGHLPLEHTNHLVVMADSWMTHSTAPVEANKKESKDKKRK